MTMVTPDNLAEVVRQILDLPVGSPIAVDCETTGLNPYSGDVLRGFSFAFRQEGDGDIVSFYAPVGYGDLDDLKLHEIHLLCGAIQSVDPIYVYHHSKFDLRFLRQLPRAANGGKYFAVPPEGKLWDTKIVAWLLDENLSTSLDPQAKHHLGAEKSDYMKKLVKERGGWDKLTAQDTAEYGAKDAELTLMLREVQIALLDHPMTYGNPAPAIAREHAVQCLLLRMEDTGILIDQDRLEQLRATAERVCTKIETRFREDYGVNVNSPKQVAELLFDTLGLKTPKAQVGHLSEQRNGAGKKTRSVNRATLEQLLPNEVVEQILEQRRLRKSLSSYLTPLTEKVSPDGRIHPTFWQHGTVTGRFSCSDPNLQTIPREDVLPGVRSVFTAPEGYELWEYDLQAAEMRVVAGMAEEQVLMDGLNEGTDMHGLLASQVFGDDYTGVQRRYAKNIGYGFFYGLTSPQTAAKYISGPGAGKVAAKILEGLRALYPNVVRLMKRSQREAEAKGYVKIHDTAWPGRFRRYVTEAEHPPFPYTALNAKVQGGIGELMKDVMLAAEPHLELMGARLVLQVHDSLVIEVPEGQGENVKALLQRILSTLNPFAMPMYFDAGAWEDHD